MGNASEAAENNLPFVRRFLGIRTQRERDLRTPFFILDIFSGKAKSGVSASPPLLPPSMWGFACYGGGGGGREMPGCTEGGVGERERQD